MGDASERENRAIEERKEALPFFIDLVETIVVPTDDWPALSGITLIGSKLW